MPRRSITLRKPEAATTIRTYPEFRELISHFARGDISLLAIVGRPGLSKSKSIEEAVRGKGCYYVKGRVTPISFYTGLYHHQDHPVVIDDADDLMGNKLSREYIKALTETDEYKRLSWQSKSKVLANEEVPDFFWTKASCCIITNSWDSDDAIYGALESRAEFIHFDPDWGELYRECGNWFWDQEIFDFVYDQLDSLKQPDARLLVKAADRKKAGMVTLPWQKLIDNYCDDEAGLLLRTILADPGYPNNTRRCDEWMRLTGKDRATFYRRMAEIKRFRPTSRVDRIELKRSDRPKRQRPADGVVQTHEEF